MIVISRKYALGAIGIFICLFFLFKPQTTEISNPLSDLVIKKKITWPDFVKDCGRKVYLDNGVRAKRIYTLKYHKKEVDWEGVFMEQKSYNGKSIFFIKMIPSDSSQIYPDLAMFMNARTSDEIKQEKAIRFMLKRGDVIQFKGKFTHLGNEFVFHELSMISAVYTSKTFNLDERIEIIRAETNTLLRKELPDDQEFTEREKKLKHEVDDIQ